MYIAVYGCDGCVQICSNILIVVSPRNLMSVLRVFVFLGIQVATTSQ